MLNTRKRQRENGSQTDEDTPAGGHCCDASKLMAEINAKLDKILQVMAEFDAVKTRMTQLEEENMQLKLAAENTAVEIVDLKATYGLLLQWFRN